jgi:uncharacterized protein YegJ (DUF2314 family)
LLKKGDYIKVGYLFENGTERFWIAITKIEGNKFYGTIDNDLVCTTKLLC